MAGTAKLDRELFNAVRKDDARRAAHMLQRGANPNQPISVFDRGQIIPSRLLHMTVEQRKVECVRALLSAGCEVDAKNGRGLTALHLARTADLASMLLARGANPGVQSPGGDTPLHFVYDREHMQVLLDAGADPSVENGAGSAPHQSIREVIDRMKISGMAGLPARALEQVYQEGYAVADQLISLVSASELQKGTATLPAVSAQDQAAITRRGQF